MNVAALLRALGFCALLPLGGLAPRLAVGLAFGAVLASRHPSENLPTAAAMLAEVLLGAALGLLAGLPVQAARAMRGTGPESLGRLGVVWAWAVFFAAGGPLVMLTGLDRTLGALPAGAWPDAATFSASLAERGGLLFTGAFLCALPGFVTGLLIEPAAALVDRVFGAPILAAPAVAVRALAAPVALALAAPWLAETLRDLLLGGLP